MEYSSNFTNFEKSYRLKIETIVEYLSCLLVPVSCLFLTIYLIYVAHVNCTYDHLLAWHVLFGTLAFITLMPESIIILSTDIKYQKIEKKVKDILHGIIIGLASIFALASYLIEKFNSNEKFEKFFPSSHVVTGLISIVFLIMANLFGIFYSMPNLIPEKLRSTTSLQIIHNIIGHGAFIFGMISICLSYYTDWFIGNCCVKALCLFITILITIWTLVIASLRGYLQLKKVSKNK